MSSIVADHQPEPAEQDPSDHGGHDASPQVSPAEQPAGLTEHEVAVLEFERSWWKHPGAKESAIRDRFDRSPTQHYAELNRLIDDPLALAHDPMLVKRLQRLRASRRAQRSQPTGA